MPPPTLYEYLLDACCKNGPLVTYRYVNTSLSYAVISSVLTKCIDPLIESITGCRIQFFLSIFEGGEEDLSTFAMKKKKKKKLHSHVLLL